MQISSVAQRAASFRLLTLLLLVALLAACSRQSQFDALPSGSQVLVLGDSLAAGYGLTASDAWPALLAQASGWQVINAGISGNTSAQGLERIEDLLHEYAPQAVMIELGGNDMLRRVPAADTVANLRRMIDLSQAAGAKVILVSVPQPSLAGAAFSSLGDADFYAALAKELRLPLLGDTLSDVLSQPQYKLDKLHPNAEGHRRISEGFVTQLRELGLLRAR